MIARCGLEGSDACATWVPTCHRLVIVVRHRGHGCLLVGFKPFHSAQIFTTNDKVFFK